MPTINNPNPTPAVDRPRVRVMYAGLALPGCSGASITSTNNYTGDTFNATFATDLRASGAGSPMWWSSQDGVIQVDVQMGLVPPGAPESEAVWTTMLSGVVDRISCDPMQGTISIDGRDLTALLRDSSPGAYDINQTSSELVTKLATMNGLTPVVTATTAMVGRYFQIDHALTGLSDAHHIANQWDAVVELARFEGFDAFVSGNELHFQPPADEASDPWVVNVVQDPQSGVLRGNVEGLQLQRAQHIAKGVKVRVLSWHSKNGRATTVTVGSGGSSAQVYTVIRPGLTPDQAATMANRYLVEITRHERTISGSTPGDMLLTPRVVMALQGTGTGFDQPYYPVSVTRRIDQGGFSMDFQAKNQTPQVQSLTSGPGF
jgi:hypothetical protein